MKTLLEMITIEMKEAFKAAGYDEELARVTLSNRPDLCEYQCNGAMAGAKKYKKAPIMIANAVVEELADSKYFASAEAVNPGFINLKPAPEVVAEYLNEMAADENLGVEKEKNPKKLLLITADRTWQNRCMSDIFVLRLSERALNVLSVLKEMM